MKNCVFNHLCIITVKLKTLPTTPTSMRLVKVIFWTIEIGMPIDLYLSTSEIKIENNFIFFCNG